MDDRYKHGRGEVLPDTPSGIPVRFRRTGALTDAMKAFIRDEISKRAGDEGFETFAECDDFDIADDVDLRSPHEQSLDEELDGKSIVEVIGDTIRAFRKEKAAGDPNIGKGKGVEDRGEDPPVDDTGEKSA